MDSVDWLEVKTNKVNNWKNRKAFLFSMIVIIVFCTTGCNFNSRTKSIENKISNLKSEKEKPNTKKESDDEKYIRIIIGSITSDDVEPLYNELSNELKKKNGIKDRLEQFVHFVDSRQIQVLRISSSTSWWQPTEKKDKSGNYYTTVKSNPGYLVKDENNTKYFISIIYYPDYKENPEKTGINYMEIDKENESGKYIKTLKIQSED